MFRDKIASTKNFVRRHKVGLSAIVLCATFGAGARMAASDFNEFLEEHDMLDTYYNSED